jgi:putative membrane protein
MWLDALLAYAHFIAIFLLFGFLTVEIMLLRTPLDASRVLLLARCDAWYGASAIAMIITGLLRIFAGAKGGGFYLGNPVFWLKMAMVAGVALLSLRTTFVILAWARTARGNAGFAPDEASRAQLRRAKMIEVHVAAIVPLAAVLMARGVGL